MKKKSSILIVLIILLIPFIVNAKEQSAIGQASYDVIVVNPKGVETYTYEENLEVYETIDSGTIIIIQDQEKIGNDVYLYGTIKDTPITIYVKESDVYKLYEEVETSDKIVKKADTKIPFKVATSKGVPVLKGPADGYDEKGILASGTVGTYEYYLPDSKYIYINSGELSGWVDGSESKLYYKDRGSIITVEEIELSCAKVPPNTLLESPWYTEEEIGSVLLEYKNCSELWYYKDSKQIVPILEKPVKKYVQKEIRLYNRIGGQSLLTIKEGTRIKILSEIYKNEKPIDRDMPASYYYVQVGEDKGWIEDSNGLLTDKLEEEEEEEPPKEIIDDSKDEETEAEKTLREEAEKQKRNREAATARKEKIKNTIVTCIVGGVLISLVVVIIMVLANKKKKKKQEAAQKAPQEEIEVLDLNEKD